MGSYQVIIIITMWSCQQLKTIIECLIKEWMHWECTENTFLVLKQSLIHRKVTFIHSLQDQNATMLYVNWMTGVKEASRPGNSSVIAESVDKM